MARALRAQPATRPPCTPRLRERRGIYLISTLLLLTFLVMLGGAIAVSFQQGLASSGCFNNRQMALGAAMSGLQYIQARLESNPITYGPGYVGATDQMVVDVGGFKVREAQDTATKGVNICGYLDNSSVAGAGGMPVTLLFRACFNSSYSEFAAKPDRWTPISTFNSIDFASPPQGWPAMGPMDYVSMNNILRSSQLPVGYSYRWSGTTSQTFKQVPGGTANVFVEGLVVRADGLIVARRMVECMYSLSGLQSPNAPGAASAAQDMNISLYQNAASGGGLDVGVAEGVNATLAGNSGLAAYTGNINMNGLDAATSTTGPPPGYTASSRASVASDKAFVYAWTSGNQTLSQTYAPNDSTQSVVQAQQVAPPAIPDSALPAMPSARDLDAGTYVVWNGNVYRYEVNYNADVALADQSWQGGTGATDPPTLNNKPGVLVSLPAGMTFSPTDNTLTVSNDVLVRPASNSTHSFAFLVAPEANQPSGAANSATKGSAQIVFDASSGSSPQFRSPGNLAVVGNVTGQGALVATGTQGTSTGNVTVIGKSALDTRSDSGVAVYARGSVTVQQLSYGQAPAGVPSVKDSLASIGVTAGSGNSTNVRASNLSSKEQAVYAALTQALQGAIKKDAKMLDEKGVVKFFDNGQTLSLGNVPSDKRNEFGDKLKDQKVTVSYTDSAGAPQSYPSTKLKDVLKGIYGYDFNDGKAVSNVIYDGIKTSGGTTLLAPLVGGWTAGSSRRVWESDTNQSVSNISVTEFGNYQSTGTSSGADAATVTGGAVSTATGSGGSGSPNPAPGGGTVTTAALNQTFAGLVYAGRDINIRNNLGNISVTGMMAAFGGDPNNESRPSGVGGSINLSANSISLTYDPTTVGPYLYLFGGVKLRHTTLSNF